MWGNNIKTCQIKVLVAYQGKNFGLGVCNTLKNSFWHF